jgi:hypothetical protein
MYMRLASIEHESARPFSAAVRIQLNVCRLLRVTPQLWAWQITLATSCDAIQLKRQGYYMWRMMEWGRHRAWQMMLATSCDANKLKKRG